jgi:hypothetical protein
MASAAHLAALPSDSRSRLTRLTARTSSNNAHKGGVHLHAKLLASVGIMFSTRSAAGSETGPTPGLNPLPAAPTSSAAGTDSRVGSAATITTVLGGASRTTTRTAGRTTAWFTDSGYNHTTSGGAGSSVPYRGSQGSIFAQADGVTPQAGGSVSCPLRSAPPGGGSALRAAEGPPPPPTGMHWVGSQGESEGEGVHLITVSPPPAAAPGGDPSLGADPAVPSTSEGAGGAAAAAAAAAEGAGEPGAAHPGHPADNLLRCTSLESLVAELRGLAFIGSGASGNVYSCAWRGMPVCGECGAGGRVADCPQPA